jgi:formiminotetrahydrofolate cyclodeaminase
MIAKMNLLTFITELSGSAPTPGGGGASAITGAMGVALAGMVASLTLKSDRYSDVRAEMADIKAQSDELQMRLIELADEDARVFAPLAAAYKIPKDSPSHIVTLENALVDASLVPLEIMRVCVDSLRLFPELREKGTKMAMSDVYAGELLCKTAIKAASFNVFINTKLMKNKAKAKELDDSTWRMVEEWCC